MPVVTRAGPPSPPRGYPLDIVIITHDTTINANHCDCVLQVNSASTVTLTLPRDLPIGFSFLVEQAGAGTVTLAAGSGATLINRQSFTGTAGQYAVITAYVRANAHDVAAIWLLAGDAA